MGCVSEPLLLASVKIWIGKQSYGLMAKKDDVEELKKMKYDEKSEFFQIFLDFMALFFPASISI